MYTIEDEKRKLNSLKTNHSLAKIRKDKRLIKTLEDQIHLVEIDLMMTLRQNKLMGTNFPDRSLSIYMTKWL